MLELNCGEISFVDKIPLMCAIDLTTEVVTDEISLDLSLKWVTWKPSVTPPSLILPLDDKAGNPAEILWLQRHKRIRSTPTADISYDGLQNDGHPADNTFECISCNGNVWFAIEAFHRKLSLWIQMIMGPH